MRHRFSTVALVLSLSIFSSGSVLAEDQPESIQTGNFYGTVVDDQGTPLPGVTLFLTGGVHPQAQVTDSRGRFRFVDLRPGGYAIKAEMEGFTTLEYSNIVISIGRNTTLEMTMSPAGEDVVTVEAESPLLDERRDSADTIAVEDLEKIPTARDPWAMLQSTPGVLVDRINVGGNESGCGSSSLVKDAHAEAGQGFSDPEAMLVSAMATAGFLPAELDFDAVREIPEPGEMGAMAQPPAWILPRRGTNEARASGSYLESGGDLAGGGRRIAAPEGAVESNRIESLRAGRVELGGPLRRDNLWAWGEAGFHQVRRIALGGQGEEQAGRSGRFKLNAQMGENVSALLAASRGLADGSGIGAGPRRAPETTWEEDGRETIQTAESTVIFSPNLFSTASLARSDRRFDDAPRSAAAAARIGPDGVARGSWFGVREEQRTRQARLSSTLYTGGSAYHEIVLGGGWRRQEDVSFLAPPDSLVVSGSVLGLADGLALAEQWRGGRAGARTETRGLWIQDTRNAAAVTAVFSLQADGQDLGIAGGPRPWTLSPRLQLTRALGTDRDTLVSASVGRFASRLDARVPWHVDPGAPAVLRSLFADRDGDLLLDPDEPLRLLHGEGLDPLSPDLDPDAVSPHLRPEISDEAVLGLHHALRPELVVGLRAHWRRTRHLLEERLLARDAATGEVLAATAGDWVPAGRLAGNLPDGTPYDVPFWDLRPGLQWTGGTLLVNGDREREDFGLSLNWEKRLADRWMSRGQILWQDSHQSLGSAFRRFDDPTNTLGGGDDQGRSVPEITSGRPHETPRFTAARWSFHATGLLILNQYGSNLAIGVNGRQGQPLPYYRQVTRERAGLANVQLTGRPDAFRSQDVLTVDAELEQEFSFRDFSVTLSLEAANLLNPDTVRERELDLGTGRGAFAEETLASRAFRLEVRMSWR